MDPKGYLRRGRKSMNLIPEGFALKVVSPVYLLRLTSFSRFRLLSMAIRDELHSLRWEAHIAL
jgi:hypothetical protein